MLMQVSLSFRCKQKKIAAAAASFGPYDGRPERPRAGEGQTRKDQRKRGRQGRRGWAGPEKGEAGTEAGRRGPGEPSAERRPVSLDAGNGPRHGASQRIAPVRVLQRPAVQAQGQDPCAPTAHSPAPLTCSPACSSPLFSATPPPP